MSNPTANDSQQYPKYEVLQKDCNGDSAICLVYYGKCGNQNGIRHMTIGYKECKNLDNSYFSLSLKGQVMVGTMEDGCLVEHGADVNAQGGYYGSALQAAVTKGKGMIVRYLVVQGADVNAQGGRYGNSLYVAVNRGDKDIVRYLVEHGADFNAQRKAYGNALYVAVNHGNEDIVRCLVENRADVNLLR
jgi:ankyrin repeat protein